MTLRCRPAHR